MFEWHMTMKAYMDVKEDQKNPLRPLAPIILCETDVTVIAKTNTEATEKAAKLFTFKEAEKKHLITFFFTIHSCKEITALSPETIKELKSLMYGEWTVQEGKS